MGVASDLRAQRARLAMADRVRALMSILCVNRTILYAVGAKFWTAMSGVITLLLIARLLTQQEQGYYYSFGSILGLQIFFELGFAAVLIQFASHGSARLRWRSRGYLKGPAIDRRYFIGLARIAIRWYATAGLLMIIVVLPAGLWFFSSGDRSGSVAWKPAWACLVLAAAAFISTNSVFLLLEGLGKVTEVAIFRLLCSILATAASWLAFFLGFGLFALAAAYLAQAIMAIFFIFRRYGFFVRWLLRRSALSTVNYFSEIFPLHWKTAVCWASGFFIAQALIPIAFKTAGPVAAGQVGFSAALASTLTTLALAWVNTKVPYFGRLIASGNFTELNAMFNAAFLRSTLLMLASCVAVLLFRGTLEWFDSGLGHRMLGMRPLAMLLGATLSAHIVTCQAMYLRSFKKEPYLVMSIVWGPSVTVAAVFASKFYGATGMLSAYLAVNLLIILPWSTAIFIKKKSQWTSVATAASGR